MAETQRSTVAGWGNTARIASTVVTPSSEGELVELLSSSRDGVIARGLGRSYGDPAQVAGGVVVSNAALREFGPIDRATGLVTLGSGVSIDTLLSVAIPHGFFVPVTPGTRQVTIGGAIASDIHGKNHHVDGSFMNHVHSLDLVTPTGIRHVSPTHDPELFWATAGGMGLTGIIVRATIKLLPIASAYVTVDTTRHRDLDDVMAAMIEGDHRYRYSVAWVDCMTSGARLGRGVLTRGDHAPADLVAGRHGATEAIPTKPRLTVPFDAPSGLLNRLSITAFNEAWYRRAPKQKLGGIEKISTFFHPLDGVANWNRLYGSRGFVQYQFVVPDDQADAIRLAIEKLSASKVPSFLAVLKRFGPSNPSPMSFPTPGWTLALDLPVGPSALPRVLDELDELVSQAGGRIYFAKDSRLSPARVAEMYPGLEAFRAVLRQVDPEGVMVSDLSRRLNLRGTLHA
jgi:decaprenylphospho-beta-D-ribofuranose 2-oxidase